MRPLKLPLATARLKLRGFADSDIDAVHAYQCRTEIARFQFWEPRSREEVAERMAGWRALDGRDATQNLALAVTRTGSDQVIGDVVLLLRDPEGRQGEIGFSLHPDFQGQGFATEAVTALISIGFSHYGLHRIFARCDARNTPSWRLMERIGMRREAHFREHALFKGAWDEEFHYAVLDREWGVV